MILLTAATISGVSPGASAVSAAVSVHIVAGCLILTSLALAHWVDPRWINLAVFVGLNLFQSGLTGVCALERILIKMGVPKGGCGDALNRKV